MFLLRGREKSKSHLHIHSHSQKLSVRLLTVKSEIQPVNYCLDKLGRLASKSVSDRWMFS